MEELAKKEGIRETINKLYALRAGLSLVEKEHDKVRKEIFAEEREIRVAELNKTKLAENNKKMSQEIVKMKEKSLSSFYQYESDLKHYNFNMTMLKDAESKYKRKKLFFIILTSIFAPMIIIFFSLMVFNFDATFETIMFNVSGPISAISVFAWVPVLISFIKSSNSYNYRKSIMFRTPVAPKYGKESYLHEPQYLLNMETVAQNNEKIEEIDTNIIEKKQETKTNVLLISQHAIEMYKLITKEFSVILPILDQRDYKNVDLIIYLLETGRAETMKEVLQQVDIFINTEKIVQAINNASRTISQSVRLNSEMIKQTIQKTSYELGNKLDRITYNINAMSDRQSALMKELNDNISKTNSMIEMQNALFEKSNYSSQEMAENVEQMRLYADEFYIKRVNKWENRKKGFI